MPKINPKQMAQMMKQMGISQERINAVEVIIRTPEHDLVISNPEVLKVNMSGQVTFQIAGEVEERRQEVEQEIKISQDDIKTVMDQTGAGPEEAEAAIAAAQGDLAKAILELQDSEEESEE